MKNKTFLTWFALGHLANDWPVAALWLIVPVIGIEMQLSPTEIGLLVGTLWWGAIGYAVATVATTYWSLAVLLAIAGMGNAAWHPIATGTLTRQNKGRRGQALGIHAIGGSLAEVLAPLVAGFLLAYVNWRGALMISVLPTLLLGICFIWVERAVPLVEKTSVRMHDMHNLLNAWRQGNGLRMIAMICLYNMGLLALLSMIPLYLASVHNFTPIEVGLTFSALLIAVALAQPIVGKTSDVAGRRPVLVIGNLTAGLASASLILQPALFMMLAAMAIAVAALGAIRAAMLAAAADYTEQREATTLGFAFVIMDGIGALGAVLAGIAAGVSWPHMFGLAAIFSFSAAWLAFGTVFGRSSQSEG